MGSGWEEEGKVGDIYNTINNKKMFFLKNRKNSSEVNGQPISTNFQDEAGATPVIMRINAYYCIPMIFGVFCCRALLCQEPIVRDIRL